MSKTMAELLLVRARKQMRSRAQFVCAFEAEEEGALGFEREVEVKGVTYLLCVGIRITDSILVRVAVSTPEAFHLKRDYVSPELIDPELVDPLAWVDRTLCEAVMETARWVRWKLRVKPL